MLETFKRKLPGQPDSRDDGSSQGLLVRNAQNAFSRLSQAGPEGYFVSESYQSGAVLNLADLPRGTIIREKTRAIQGDIYFWYYIGGISQRYNSQTGKTESFLKLLSPVDQTKERFFTKLKEIQFIDKSLRIDLQKPTEPISIKTQERLTINDMWLAQNPLKRNLSEETKNRTANIDIIKLRQSAAI